MQNLMIMLILGLGFFLIFTEASPVKADQIERHKRRHVFNINRLERKQSTLQRKINRNKSDNILRRRRLEAKKARLELIDEMLEFYWDTLEVVNIFQFAV